MNEAVDRQTLNPYAAPIEPAKADKRATISEVWLIALLLSWGAWLLMYQTAKHNAQRADRNARTAELYKEAYVRALIDRD